MELPKELILAQDREFKLKMLDELSRKKMFGEWMQFVNVLLEAPISEGGIETDIITTIWDKYNAPKQNSNQ